MQLSREAIQAIDDLIREKLFIPEWGQDAFVYVCVMPGTARDELEAESVDLKDGDTATKLKNFRARLAVRTVCDETGKLLFTKNDIEWLGKKSCAALDRIYDVAARLNKIGQKDIENTIKN